MRLPSLWREIKCYCFSSVIVHRLKFWLVVLPYSERVSAVQRNFTSTVMLKDPRIYPNWLRAKKSLRVVRGMSSLHSGSLLLPSADTYTHTQSLMPICNLGGFLYDDLTSPCVLYCSKKGDGGICYFFLVIFRRLLHTTVQVPKISWNCLIKWDESTECRTQNCWMNASDTAQCTYGRCTFLNSEHMNALFYTFLHSLSCAEPLLYFAICVFFEDF